MQNWAYKLYGVRKKITISFLPWGTFYLVWIKKPTKKSVQRLCSISEHEDKSKYVLFTYILLLLYKKYMRYYQVSPLLHLIPYCKIPLLQNLLKIELLFNFYCMNGKEICQMKETLITVKKNSNITFHFCSTLFQNLI